MTSVLVSERDLDILSRVFRRFPWIQEVRVFGSRATGHAKRASDIDLAIFTSGPTIDQWLELRDALESAPIIYELDIFRADQPQNVVLAEKIEREGIPIYPRT